MQSWKTIDPKSDFSIYNIPFGIYTRDGNDTFVCSRIGDEVIDLSKVAALGIFDNLNIPADIWTQPVLNPFIALGRNKTGKVRTLLQEELSNSNSILKDSDVFIPISEVRMLMPVEVGDYTDFYSSIEHATNVGKLFRDPDNALLPNWKHLPVGYHGRASSIIVSDVDIKRPKGQTKPADGPPVFGPSQRMDFELEMAFIIGKDSTLGEPISTQEATDYIFGMCLFNDWSARDIQKWEYVPLGPFLGKNFASSVSPWIVTLEALAPFKVDGPVQDPKVLPYLEYTGKYNYDIHLTVSLTPEGGHENIISESNYKYMYWNMAQQLAHHTINGCNVRIGDMMASGTISGKTESSYGSMLEITQAGKNPLVLDDGSERKFLQDNDRVTMRGYCEKDGIRVGFGEVTSKLLP
jgi:fumarylacetoacetase